MNSIINKVVLTLILAASASSCIIQDARPEDCETRSIELVEIREGVSNDIVLVDADGETYYINRGLEKGMQLEKLQEALVDKKVNLHLYKFWFGTSDHISQLSLEDQVVFTEFK